jgi:hypothetical protein
LICCKHAFTWIAALETQAAARNVLVTGMIVGTLFTLIVVPVFYTLIAADHGKCATGRDEVAVGTAFVKA